jgi:hypothetical protein
MNKITKIEVRYSKNKPRLTHVYQELIACTLSDASLVSSMASSICFALILFMAEGVSMFLGMYGEK